MSKIHRVLWIDDVAQNRASHLFPVEETKIVTSMDSAIEEISGEHLYDYDTIVLDIDFENGIHAAKEVIERLSEQIYLSDEQRENKFLISNGGYLLYLFLLKRGYPSNQIAFLTGNPAIVEQLKIYTKQNERQLTKSEIESAFLSLWKEYADDLDSFEDEVEKLPIDREYTHSDFLIDCEEALDAENFDELTKLIGTVSPKEQLEQIENTGDMMIFRFHQANLEAPAYFSKQDDDIEGHNKADAKKWLESLRTKDQITRWLMLSAGNHIEEQFTLNPGIMVSNYSEVYKVPDLGIRSSFRQMYFVLDGLRSGVHKEVYFQAISAMLVPFEAFPDDKADKNGVDNDIRVRYLSAWCTKIARNLLAHNRFGTVISAKTSLFVIMMAVSSILSKDQKNQFNFWYEKCVENLEDLITGSSSILEGNDKIEALLNVLFQNNDIDVRQNKARAYSTYQQYSFRDTMYALTNNVALNNASLSAGEIENYFLFSLAAGYVKWFNGKNITTIGIDYGKQVENMYLIALKLVNEYYYPLRQI